MDVVDLLPSLPSVAQGGLLLFLLGAALRFVYVERREHREEITAKNARLAAKDARIRELEEQHHATVTKLEQEIDAERDKRRAAEDLAAQERRIAHALRSTLEREGPPS